MVYDPKARLIFLFGGQSKDKHLSDLWSFQIDTGIAVELGCNSDQCDGVEAFSPRAVIDSSLSEIYA